VGAVSTNLGCHASVFQSQILVITICEEVIVRRNYKNRRIHIRTTPSTVAKRLARHFTFGRSRVLTPVPPDQVWVFSEVSPHHHIVVCLISQIRRMLGQYQPLSTYHLPSAPILTVPIQNLPVSVAEKALESLSSPPPFGGNERCPFHQNDSQAKLTALVDIRIQSRVVQECFDAVVTPEHSRE
jgi:hypothetical protein